MSYILDALLQADRERRPEDFTDLPAVQPPFFPAGGLRRRWLATVSGVAVLAGAFSLAWIHLELQPVPTPQADLSAVLPADESREEPGALTLAAPLRLEWGIPELPAARREVRREPPPPGPGSRLYRIGELPAALQAVARNIAIAGFAHASDVNERMAIINDRAVREGDEVTEGLRVESISSDGVVFNLKGYRFRKGGA